MKLSFRSIILSAVVAGAFSIPASADTLTLKLDCILNPPNGATPCQSGPSFGSVVLTDTGVNSVQLTVDLLNSQLKFKDLMLNLTNPAAFTDITASDGTNLVIASNTYFINPYDGKFDLGASGGWDKDAPYTVTLSGVGGTLSVASFNAQDSLNKMYVALHIQSIGNSSGGNCEGPSTSSPCVPGTYGTGSLKIGGTLDSYVRINEVPEPQSAALLGSGLVALAFAAKRMRRK